jgi:hypothetical protein
MDEERYIMDEETYNRLWEELIATQPEQAHEYFLYHKKRYYELFDTMALYLSGQSCRVLEVGVSGFLSLYKKLFPNMSLVTIDRPVELKGANAFYCVEECGAERHYNIDLNRVQIDKNFGDPPLGTFNFVICTEVIEHLMVNPIEFIRGLLTLIEPGGHLYLTTPNFISYQNIQKIKNHENPQPVFPGIDRNEDHGHHFREYTMRELSRFTREAGGHILSATYSDCWDDMRLAQLLSEHPEQRSNIVIVASSSRDDVKDNILSELDSEEEILWDGHSVNKMIELQQDLSKAQSEIRQMEDKVSKLVQALSVVESEIAHSKHKTSYTRFTERFVNIFRKRQANFKKSD